MQPETNAVYFRQAGGRIYELAYWNNHPPLLVLGSSDLGATWKSPLEGAGRLDSLAWQGIRESEFIGRYWVVTGRDGIYRSSDSGATWKRIADLPWPGDYRHNQVLELSASLVAVNDYGIYRSLDSGAVWQKQSGGLRPGAWLPVQALGPFLIAFEHDSTYRSSDFGFTWQSFHSPVLSPPALAVGGDLYARMLGDNPFPFMRSADSGASWNWAGTLGNLDDSVSGLASAGDTIFAVTQNTGVYRSFDQGAHFQQTSWPVLGEVSLMANGNSVWAGTGSEDSLFRFKGDGDGWVGLEVSSDRLHNIRSIAFEGETVLTAEACCAVHLSRDGGRNWIDPPLSGANVLDIWTLAVKDGALMLASGGGIYRYFDTTSEWRCVRTLPRTGFHDAGFLVTKGAAFFGDSAGVFRSRNAGLAWDTVNRGLEGEVRVLADGGEAIYAGGTRGVFRSGDQGDSWAPMNPGKTRFTALAALGGTLFAGDDSGVSVSRDSGRTWARASEGLAGSISVSSVAVFGKDLYAATDASVWKRPLQELAPGIESLSRPSSSARRSLDLHAIATRRGPAFAFYVPAKGPVRLEMFDLSGRKAGTLVDGVLDRGPAEAVVAGREPARGAYILRLRAGGLESALEFALTR